MAKTCAECGKPLSFFERLGSSKCPECQAEADRKQAAAEKAEAEERARLEREAAERRYAAGLEGKASAEDLQRLAADGYLIAAGRLIRCPICGHDRFHQQRVLMTSRAAAFFKFTWASEGADTRICQRCTYVMLFARE
ncbi:MAG: hypothetical protein ABSG53_09365 [Thermoguttaceae bacterium]|jgi:uncharacterized Zn finger protein (UPF0148 family)